LKVRLPLTQRALSLVVMIALWDSKDKQVAEFNTHQGSIYLVAISTDKQTIVSGGGILDLSLG